ncbi:hypothetical protein POP12_192 [Pectobacterium phage POP12]|nr:hypothetical protein POP12_192 [Pectobacterium phage POP12]
MSINFENLKEEIQPFQDEKEPEYDKPNGSKWIVAVADDGKVFLLKIPNIHHSFTDDARSAEEFGLPDEVDDMEAGVYEWTCDLELSTDWETGYVDDWSFYVTETKLLWKLP